MDITTSNNKLFANKFFNGETVNYGICFMAVSFLFIVLKQFCKITFGMSATVAVTVSFVIAAVFLFLLERKYVFNKKVKTALPLQAALSVVRLIVDFGFYKLSEFLFGNILRGPDALVCIIAATLMLVFNYYFDRLIVFDCRSNPVNNYNGRAYKLFFDNRFVVLAGVVAFACISFVYIVLKAFPYGEITVMRMDLYHQYGPLYCELFDRVTEHKSFIYSWVSGGGTSFLGNYFNYLSSPFSFIILLFDRNQMPYAITTMVMVKCVLSSVTFAYYLKISQKSHCYASAAFGTLYAFCAYFLAYYWNIMWLDGMILFPLIILGIEKIVDNRKPLLYIASLTVLLYSTYYIGFMTCLFAIVYFIAYFLISSNPADTPSAPVKPKNTEGKKVVFSLEPLRRNKFISSGFTFAASSAFAGMLCAVTLIPIYLILQSSSATSDSWPSSTETYFDLLTLITSHLAGLTTTIRSSGEDVLPNIYCGILPALLLPLYIMNKKIGIKEKTVNVLLILLFVFSFNNNYANFIWHALHFPNDLPYRFSFMYSFLILVIGYRTLKYIKGIGYRDIAIVGMFWVMLVMFYQKFPTEKFAGFTIYVSLGLIMAWTAVLLVIRKGNLTKFILGVTVLSIAFCEIIIADTAAIPLTHTQAEYLENYAAYQDTIEHVEKNDKDFYRQELCYLDTRMDPCLYGYNGISVFSSMAYEKYSGLQYSLGMFGNRINSYTYNTQTPVYNMMYNIKYLTQRPTSITPSDDFYEMYYAGKDGQTDVFKNKYYMPIAFVTSNEIDKWECEEGNPFDVQEDFIDRAAGVSNIFVPCKYVSTQTYNCDCEDITENGVYSFSKDGESDSGTIDVTLEAATDSNLYIYISSSGIDNVNYYWDNDGETADQYIDEPYIMDLGKHKKGEQIRVELSLAGMETDSSIVDFYAYSIDKDVFESAYDVLKNGKMDVTKHGDTFIEGTVNAGFDGYLYTSIPYDEGWSVYIDGEKVKTFEIGDCMLATTIKPGKHTVKYKFTPKGLKYGVVISAAAWLCVIVLCVYRFLVRKGRKKQIQTLLII
ncbi:MAG: YfhO family protein [Eubacterium sp.]|nr:YfhO family protein [Eubacterium sp.]MBR0412478.1 YfhO family protein [Eubacterium sp.]